LAEKLKPPVSNHEGKDGFKKTERVGNDHKEEIDE